MKRALLLTILLLAPPATAVVVTHARQYPKRFAEAVPGTHYRGGYPSPSEIRHMEASYGIKTVVSMTGEQDTAEEKALLAEIKGLGLVHKRFPMPGNGCGDFAEMDGAADALAEQKNYPVYFHCAAGKQRSNAVLAAWRLKHCGWTLDKALAELEQYGLDREDERELVEHVTAYDAYLREKGEGELQDPI